MPRQPRIFDKGVDELGRYVCFSASIFQRVFMLNNKLRGEADVKAAIYAWTSTFPSEQKPFNIKADPNKEGLRIYY
jgi:hypothetical protein